MMQMHNEVHCHVDSLLQRYIKIDVLDTRSYINIMDKTLISENSPRTQAGHAL
jgi:hypothetical protein